MLLQEGQFELAIKAQKKAVRNAAELIKQVINEQLEYLRKGGMNVSSIETRFFEYAEVGGEPQIVCDKVSFTIKAE